MRILGFPKAVSYTHLDVYKRQLSRYASRGDAFVLYEAPHRIQALLRDLGAALESGRRVVVAREITKRFESFTPLAAGDLAAWADAHEPRGEYAILIDEAEKKESEMGEEVLAWVREIAKELPASKTAALVSRVTGLPRDTVYQSAVSYTHLDVYKRQGFIRRDDAGCFYLPFWKITHGRGPLSSGEKRV